MMGLINIAGKAQSRSSYLLPGRSEVGHIVQVVVDALQGVADLLVLLPFVSIPEALQ
jgi:hypothetical protein